MKQVIELHLVMMIVLQNWKYLILIFIKIINWRFNEAKHLWFSNDYSVYARWAVLAGGHPTCCNFTEEVVISGWSDGRIRSFRVDTCESLWTIDNAHSNGVTTLCISHNFKFLATGGSSGDVRVWEIRSRELISHLKEHSSTVTKVEVFDDDIHLLFLQDTEQFFNIL